MAHRFRALLSNLSGALWFLPLAIVLAAMLLAVGLIDISTYIDPATLARFPRLFGASADSSRAMLGAIAGSMITVAGVTFSITMVAVTQASSQYTPRILRNFMRDHANQVVLGVFVGIFAYSLVVLRTIRGAGEIPFVPSIAVLGGIVLAIAGIGVLIFFVHHMTSTLQASGIIERVSRETLGTLESMFPAGVADEADNSVHQEFLIALRDADWHAAPAHDTGYIRGVDAAALIAIAEEQECVIRMERAIGDFVIDGTPIASVASGPRRGSPLGSDVLTRVGGAYMLSSYRTVEQDPAFGVRQLVDIALKALSPGVNDTTTAVSCVDYLGAILVRLTHTRVEDPFRATDGAVRIIARGPTFESMLRESLDQIRQNAGGNVGVLARVFGTIATLAKCTHAPDRRALLDEQIGLFLEVVERSVKSSYDRELLQDLARDAVAANTSDRP